MKKLAELRQERAAKVNAQKEMLDKRRNENREFTQEEATRFEGLDTEINQLDEQIKRAQAYEAAEKRAAELAGTPVVTSAEEGEQRERAKMQKRFSLHKAIRAQMGNVPFDGVEKEIHDETVKRAAASNVQITGLAIPAGGFAEKRADGQTVTADSGAYGANLVATETQDVIEALRPKPVLASLGARMLTGLTGNIAFPTNDGGIAATWEGEVATVAATKNAIGQKTMVPHRLAVHALLSLQNLWQSASDLEQMTAMDIAAVIGNEFDGKAINGSGASNQPTGILNLAGVNSVAVGTNGGAPTWAHIVDMESKVFIQNANGARMAYLINPATKGKLKQTKHSAGDLNYLMAMDNTINGYPAGVSNLVPSNLTKGTGTNLSAGVFGDFSQLIMGQWGFYDLTVDNVSRKVDGYVALIVNTFVDVLARHDKAFTVVKDWDLTA